MTVRRRIFTNMFWIGLSEVSSKGITFLGTVYLARVLDKAGFGLFSLSLAVGIYFWAIADIGIMSYGIREVSQDRNRAGELYRELNSLRFTLAIIIFAIFCAILFSINMAPEKRLALLAGSFFTVSYSLCPDWVFQGLEKLQYVAFGSIANAAIFLLSICLFVKSPSGAILASFIYSASFLIETVILMLLMRKKCGIPFSLVMPFSKWRAHIKESFYFAVNSVFNNVSISIPIFFMGVWASPESIGVFSAPHRIAVLIARAGALSITALYPVLSNLYATNKNTFQRTHAKFQKIIFMTLIPACAITTILSREIMLIVFGPSYTESAGIFRVLTWLSFILLLRYSFGNALLSAGLQKFNMIITGAGATLITLGSIILIPKYKGYGAVWALMIGEFATLLLMRELFKKKIYRKFT